MARPSKSSIITYSGKYVDPLNFKPEDVDTDVIAHALSNICRFNGHTREFYSVAQHSVHVAERVQELIDRKSVTMLALFHDAGEAYIADVSRPVKQTPQMEMYVEMLDQIDSTIIDVLIPGLQDRSIKEVATDWDIVTRADLDLLGLEGRQLGNEWLIEEWDIPLPTFSRLITPLAPRAAERFFRNFLTELRYGI